MIHMCAWLCVAVCCSCVLVLQVCVGVAECCSCVLVYPPHHDPHMCVAKLITIHMGVCGCVWLCVCVHTYAHTQGYKGDILPALPPPFVCMHACMHTYLYACMHACTYVYMYVCSQASKQASMHIRCIQGCLLCPPSPPPSKHTHTWTEARCKEASINSSAPSSRN